MWHSILLYLFVAVLATIGLAYVAIVRDANEMTAIHDEGCRAAKDGLPPTACPYPQTPMYQTSYLRWMRGYGKAVREQRQAKESPR